MYQLRAAREVIKTPAQAAKLEAMYRIIAGEQATALKLAAPAAQLVEPLAFQQAHTAAECLQRAAIELQEAS